MATITAESMANLYWLKLKVRAIYELELKLSRYKEATAATRLYWNTVLNLVKKKAMVG